MSLHSDETREPREKRMLYQHKVARMQSMWPPEYLVVAQSEADAKSIEASPNFIGWLKDADA